MTVTVKLEGFKELEAELEKLSKSAGKGVLRRVLKKAAQPVADAAKASAPDDPSTSGKDLKSSIGVGTKLSKRQAAAHRKMFKSDRASVEMFVGAGPLPHAHLQEFGTVHHAPQPFMRPAWEQEKGPMLERLKADLWAEISASVGRAERRAAKAARAN